MEKSNTKTIIHPAIRRDQLVTIADLHEFKEELLLSIVRILKDTSTKSPKKWLKSREVKALLGISNGTLHTLRIDGSLPFTKIGNIFFYDYEDVNAMLAGKRTVIPIGGPIPRKHTA